MSSKNLMFSYLECWYKFQCSLVTLIGLKKPAVESSLAVSLICVKTRPNLSMDFYLVADLGLTYLLSICTVGYILDFQV